MFRELINKPIDPIPVEYTNSLHRLAYEPDFSLTCLGIAMLKHRVENYSGITGTYEYVNEEITCVNKAIEALNKYDGIPTFCYYTYNQLGNEEEIKSLLKENGLVIKEPIGALIKQKADIKCVAAYHEEKNFGVIFINSRDNRYYHLLISFLSLLLPNLFKERPLEDKDYNIIKALSKNEKSQFVEQIQEAIKEYLPEFRRMMLGTLIKAMHENKIRSAYEDTERYRNAIRDYEDRLAETVRELKQAIVIYEGLKITEHMEKPEEELVEYMAKNPDIHNLTIRDNTLYFTVATLLNNYNEQAWQTFKERGYIYDGEYSARLLDAFRVEDNRKLLLDSIFSETPEFAIKIAGNYQLNMYEQRLYCSSDYNYEEADPVFKDCLPNPHIKLFACLGGYKERVNQAIRTGNLVSAIELCCASAGSVNLDETEQTFRPFLGWLLSSQKKCLHRRDGVDMTPEEALVYLSEKENDK